MTFLRYFIYIVGGALVSSALGGIFACVVALISPEFVGSLFGPAAGGSLVRYAAGVGMIWGVFLGTVAMAFSLLLVTRFTSLASFEKKAMRRIRCKEMKIQILGLAIFCMAILAALPAAAEAQSDKPMMKAIVLHEYGGPEMLKYEDAPRPEPKENELLVRVIACGVNPADPLVISGRLAKEFGTHLPLIPGYDVAGVVEKTGAKVTKFKAGDSVYGYALFGGGWAEYAVLAENEAALKPKSVSYVEAAAVPLAALTAWQALIDTAKLSAGQTALIHGGSGGVGSFAIQIAKARGARVIATASTRNQDLLKELGADEAIDYTKTKFEEVAKEVDVVLDPVGRDTLARSYAVVKKGGIVVTIVGRPDQAELEKRGIRGASVWSKPDGNELAEITKLIDEKKIKPAVGQVLPVSEARKASEQAATHHTRGKIVLKIAEEPKR